MDSIIDYIKWLGHESFEHRPLNEIDNLIFCQLSYYELGDVIKSEEVITLSECAKKMDMDKLKVRVVGGDAEFSLYREFFEAVVNAPRYKDIQISDYVDIVDDTIQFAALTFHISDNKAYVAYRGTDDTLIGWKEDFMISFTEIPAQKKAAEYIKDILQKYPQKELFVGGHSKGGNLAIYAVITLEKSKWSRIRRIYMNDAPGICGTITDTSAMDQLADKISMITPEFCVIGRLFEPKVSNYKIVKCSNSGFMQHMLLHWGVKHGELITTNNYSPESNWISETLNTWIENVTNDKRHDLVNQLFSALGENGAKTLSDLSGTGASGFEQILLDIVEGDPETLKTISRLPEKAIFGSGAEKIRNNNKFQALTKSKLAQGIAAIVSGIMFLVIPETNMEFVFMLVMTAILIILLGRTLYRLYRSKWDLYQERTFVFITVIAAVIYQFMLQKEHALFLFSNIFFGVLFLMAAYNCACILKKEKTLKKWIRVRYWIEMILFLIIGLFDFFSPEHAIRSYALSVGMILLFDGISRIVEYIQANKESL